MNDIEKSINILKARKNYISDIINFDAIKAYNLAISALEEQQANRWVPVTERLPDNEVEVDITVQRRLDDKIHTFTCRAVYEDGTIWLGDSIFCWDNFDNMEYSEDKDDYKVPEGWFESVSYVEESHVIDDFVIAWKPVSSSYKNI